MLRRNTVTKQGVLETLLKSGKALSHEEILKRISLPIDKVTIYRALNRFCDDGILHRIISDDGKQFFALCSRCNEKKLDPHHSHFRCTHCNTVECLNEAVRFSVPIGYKVNTVNFLLTGICNSCSR